MKASFQLFISVVLILFAAAVFGRGEIVAAQRGVYITGIQARIVAVLFCLLNSYPTYTSARGLIRKRQFVRCAVLLCIISTSSVALALYAIRIGWPSSFLFAATALPIACIALTVARPARLEDEGKAKHRMRPTVSTDSRQDAGYDSE